MTNRPLDYPRAREWLNIQLSESSDADFFLDIPTYSGMIEEVIDQETLDLINKIIMATTLNQVNPVYGSYTESVTGFTATFTEVGSSAIESISLEKDNLSVVFRNNNAGSTAYVYNAPSTAVETLYDEIVNVLQEGEGSVGKVFNRLVRENKIQLL